MVNYSNLKDLFTAIANAIRSKTGDTAAIVADDFPSAIAGIESHEVEDALVRGAVTDYSNNRVTYLRKYLFSESINLKSVSFPLVREIPVGCFRDCGTLKSVSFPMATHIRVNAFAGVCNPAFTIYCPKVAYVENEAFLNAPYLKSIDIVGAFYDDTGKVIAGRIYKSAFYSCTNLATVIIRGQNCVCVLKDIDVFTDTPIANGTGYIYVPASMVDAYKAAENWSTYASQIRAIEDYPEICG